MANRCMKKILTFTKNCENSTQNHNVVSLCNYKIGYYRKNKGGYWCGCGEKGTIVQC